MKPIEALTLAAIAVTIAVAVTLSVESSAHEAHECICPEAPPCPAAIVLPVPVEVPPDPTLRQQAIEDMKSVIEQVKGPAD